MKSLFRVVLASALLASPAMTPSAAWAEVGAEVVISVSPPPPKVETITVSPGPEYVWHKGEWMWSPERAAYVWHPGHWVMHPDGFTVWAPGQWAYFGGSWRYFPGHWRAASEPPAPEAAKIQIASEPPPDRVEVIPPRVSPAYTWINGHWAWGGAEYRWVPGHWGLVPAGFREWVRGHWYNSHGLFFYASGYWR